MSVFRAAVPGDRDGVLAFWPYPGRLDRRIQAAASGAEALLVAVVGEEIFGVASLRWSGGCDDPHRPLLYAVEVAPERRRRGVGSGLIRYAAALVAERGIAEMCLEVEATNVEAVRLYQHLGFYLAGPHRHVWRDGDASGTADVLIMRGPARDVATRRQR